MPVSAALNRLSVRLFGGFAVELGGRQVSLPRKAVALLAYLAAEPGAGHARQRLADLFWPDLGDAAARSNLRQLLLTLQRRLGDKNVAPPYLLADRHTIRLNPAADPHVDVAELLALAPQCGSNPAPSTCTACIAHMEAVARLYGGEFLAGIDLAECPDFEEWLAATREMLHRRALALLERLSLCHEMSGAYGRALPTAFRYTELDPWNEEGQRRLMRLLALSGQTGAALHQYEACRRILEEELGVLPEEETRMLAERIRNGEPLPAARAAAHAQDRTAAMPPLAAERRQVTVLYCQLSAVGTDDPDEVLERLRAPQSRCIETIRRYAGHIVRTNDGGLLAYFGYPQAREQAARQAVRAALAVAGERFPGLALRIGVHTGLVITGTDPNLPDTVGRASAIAIRLRAIANPGEVVVSAATEHLVSGYIECECLGRHRLQDDMPAQRVYRATGESGAVHRLEAAPTLTPFIGRESELDRLTALWEEAASGRRRVILLRGDPGIGKSRLVHALRERLAGRALFREMRCLPEFSQTPFHPAARLYEQLLWFTPEDTAESRFARLADYAEAEYPEVHLEVVPVLARMLSLPLAPPYREPEMPAQQLREQTMRILIGRIHSLAAEQPMLLVGEDLHWIDPSTLEMLSRYVHEDQGTSVPLLIVLTARTEFQPPWPDGQVPTLTLPPLADSQIHELVETAGPRIPPETVERIARHADGVPLFAEELMRMPPPASADKPTSIPATLHDLLAARLDGMGEAKSVAQLAATAGREFSIRLLRELLPRQEKTLGYALQRLREGGLVSGGPETGFRFRHALIQEAAYQSQPRAVRRMAHRRIAEILQSRFAEVAETQPEILARHWTGAGEMLQAVGWWLKAGKLAGLRSAHREAAAHFRAGLALLEQLPADGERIRLEIDLQVSLGATCCGLEGWASAEAARAYSRALKLCERHQDCPGVFQAVWGMWASVSSRSSWRDSLELARRLLRMAETSGDAIHGQQAHYATGNPLFYLGDLMSARNHLRQAMDQYRPEHHEAQITMFGENAYVTSGGFLSWTYWFLGFPDQADEVSRSILATARRLGHPFTLGYGLVFATALQCLLRRPEETMALADEAIALGRRHGFPVWEAGGAATRGWARVMQGDPDGIDEIRWSATTMRSVMKGSVVICLRILADAFVHLKRFEDALQVIEEAVELAEEIHDHHFDSELCRLRGDCLLGLSSANTAEARACFDRALSTARRQQARTLELRAAVSIARLWRAQGHADWAARLLDEVLAGLAEGFDTVDLKDAAALRDRCAAAPVNR